MVESQIKKGLKKVIKIEEEILQVIEDEYAVLPDEVFPEPKDSQQATNNNEGFFNTNFGDTDGSSIALANSFSSGKSGSA